MDIQNEIWRDAVGYEGLYEVSNFGRVRSLNYNHTGRVQVLKLKKGTHGYLEVDLHGVKHKYYRVHRLVAQAFLPNPDNLPIVNHKDEVKENNFVFIKEDGSVDFNKSNLEWCDGPYNDNYGTRNERISKAMTNGKLAKRVAQYTLDGKLVKIWESLSEIARQTGWSKGNISQCCLGKTYSQCYGFIWRYID